MDKEPLVTVNILSHNRKDELRFTLTKVFEQDYKNIEVIVVDNASSDGSAEMVKTKFPKVNLIQLEKNIGIAGWNEGFKATKGEYVLVLDDDSYPERDTIHYGVIEFLEDNNLAIVSFNVFNSRFQKYETSSHNINPFSFNGCGVLIKTEVFNFVGYFNEFIFIYFHELDFSARCYNKGYIIKQLDKTTIIHSQSLNSRGEGNPFLSSYRFYFHFLSYSVFLFQYFPLTNATLFFGKWVLNRFLIAVRYNFLGTFFKGFLKSTLQIYELRMNKKILEEPVRRFYRNGNIPFIDRDYFPNFKKPKLLSLFK